MKKSRRIVLTLIASACIAAAGCSDSEQKTERQVYDSAEACQKDWGAGECETVKDQKRYYGPHYYFIGGRPWYYPTGYSTPVETRPNMGASTLKPGALSSSAVSHVSASRVSRGGFGSSSHAHGASS
jgi:uncharacterized protein YgiB involved in biofilm formation